MNENKGNVKISVPSEKSFGIVFAVIFILIAFYPIVYGNTLRLWSLIISLIFLVLAFAYPKILRVPNRLWHKLGLLLGGLIAPIIMALVYILAIIPFGIFFKILRKDLLNEKLNKNLKSYWIKRKDTVGSMKNQF